MRRSGKANNKGAILFFSVCSFRPACLPLQRSSPHLAGRGMQMQAVDDSGSTTTLPVNVQPRRRPAFWIDWHRRLAASIDPSFILGVRTYVRAVCSAERHGCDEVVRWCFGVCACSCGQLAPEMDWAGLGWAGLTTISIWMPLSLWRAYVRAHGARTPPFPELALAGRRRTCGATTALASLVARADRHSTMRAVTANNLLFLTVESVSATSWNRPTGLFISSTPNLGPCARYPDPVHQVPTQRTLLTRAQSRPILILAHAKPLNALRLVSPPASARIVLPLSLPRGITSALLDSAFLLQFLCSFRSFATATLLAGRSICSPTAANLSTATLLAGRSICSPTAANLSTSS
jgi:hypothetical protein